MISSECVNPCPANPRPANYRLGAVLPVCTMHVYRLVVVGGALVVGGVRVCGD